MPFRLGMAPPGSNAFDFANMDTDPAAAQGAVLHKAAAAWTDLPPGTSGFFLKTQGAAANPVWAAVPGGGDMLAATYDPTTQSADAFDLANFAITAQVEGDLYTRGGAGSWVRLPIGASGNVLTSNGAGAVATWQPAPGNMTTTVYDPSGIAANAFDFVNFVIAAEAVGDILIRGAADWERLGAGSLNSIVNVAESTGRPAYTKARKEVGWFRVGTAISANAGTETIIGVTDTSIARTITIPTADIVAHRIWLIKDESGAAGTNNITVASQGAETFDGAATVVISANYGVARLYSDGTNLFTW